MTPALATTFMSSRALSHILRAGEARHADYQTITSIKTNNFHNSKAKELFALCVDRKGESISIEEATSLIWSHRIYDNRLKCLYRKAVLSIKKTLALYQASDVFQNKRGSCRIDQNRINCDYYTLIKNPERYANLFEGIYMYEYSWAESTCADIYKLLSKYRQHSKETSDFIL